MNGQTLLHRQVHPSFVHEGRVSSQAFRPTPNHEKKLSVYDGDQITAENAWKHYTQKLGCESVGAMAVTVEECEKESLPVVEDSASFAEHVLIDFSAFGGNEIVRKSKRLQQAAERRGWQYEAEAEG